MFGIVYKITNNINNKIYIGQTTSKISARWSQHKSDALARSRNTALCNAIKKYGPENFTITILSRCISLKEMNHREIYYIKLLKTYAPFGYNLTPGGLNWERSQDTRNKLASYRRGKKLSEITKLKISNSLKGEKNHNFNKKMPEHVKIKISLANKGKSHPHSNESKRKIGLANHLRVWKKESKNKLSKHRLGKILGPHSDLTKQKMSKAQNKNKVAVLCIENNIIYESVNKAAKSLSLNKSHIFSILSGTRKTTKGFSFSRV